MKNNKRQEGYYWVKMQNDTGFDTIAYWTCNHYTKVKCWYVDGELSICDASLIPLEVDERQIIRQPEPIKPCVNTLLSESDREVYPS